jgi:acyl carrier protein
MNRIKDIEKEIISIIAKCSGIEINKINKNSCASDFKKWDSLAHVSIILAIEKKYKIKINTTKMSELNSVKKILNFLN